MASRLALFLCVGSAIAAAGCGGQSHGASAVAGSAGGAGGGGAAAGNAVSGGARGGSKGASLGPHTSRAPRNAVDNEGPEKPIPTKEPVWSYHVRIGGKAMRHGPTVGSAAARVSLHGNRVCWNFGRLPKVSASSAAFGRVHASLVPSRASINVGPHGKTGPVLVPLGTRYSDAGCTAVARVVVNTIAAAPHLYYLTVVGQQFSGVSIRAQL